uniref:Transport system permease protein n=1 Tax=uncultured organism TaxID=155900 RepID=M1P282_9ZZZZ|nr:transport system permease protein [uncultured organism]
MKEKRRFSFVIAAVLGLLFLSFIFSISVGSTFIPFQKIFEVLFNPETEMETYRVIVKKIRLPRIILSFLVGSGLAISGVIFQGVIRNPMVDPYIVGISAGAGTGVTVALVLNISINFAWFDTLPLMAFAGALLTVYVVYQLARVGNKIPVMTFLLAGVALSFVLNAIMSFLMVIGTKEVHKIVYWLMGSLASGSWHEIKIMLPYFILGIIPIIFYMKDLNLILLGEENAQYLGVNVERVKKILIVSASLVTASVVSVSGSIGFIGLVIPHISRILIGPDHRKLVPLSALLGGIFLLISDDLARSLLSPMEIPVGIITALAGGPYFIYLLRKNKKEIW